MNRESLNKFLEDLTYFSEYEFLEEAKHKDELKEIAKKRGIKLPSEDLAPFKCVYAFVDRKNKNGCTLPKEEVEKSLETLVGKAVDFDHLRQRTVGYWIDAKLVDDKIIAYGIFFKSNLKEDYQIIKKLMEKGKLKVSFEAYGNREYLPDGSYNLRNIEFAGGGLLINTKPAFEDAEVLELAKERVLELASVMTPPESFVIEKAGYKCSCINCGYEMEAPDGKHCKDLKCPKCGGQMRRVERPGPGQPDKSSLHIYETNMIERLLREIEECPSCKVKSPGFSVKLIDFENDIVKATCLNCYALLKIDLEPTTEIIKKGKKIKSIKPIAVEEKSSNKFENDKDNKEKSNKEAKDMKLEDITKLLEESSEEPIIDKIFDFEGTDEELEMYLAKELEGEDFIDEEGQKIEDAKKLTYQERKKLPDSLFALVIKKGDRKIRMFPIHDESHVRNALARLAQEKVKRTLRRLGVSIESVKNKILKRAKQLNMKSLLERHKGEVEDMELKEELAKTKEELEKAKEELEKAQKVIDELKKESEEAKKKIEEIEKQKAEEIAKAKEEARIVTERRAELGEFAKDVSDEDLLNDLKYENLKLKKEIAELKNKKVEKSSLEVGSDGSDNKKQDDKDKVFELQKRIREKTWNINS